MAEDKVKFKKGYVLLKLAYQNFGQWEAAWLYKNLAYHKVQGHWCITHRRTGFCVGEFMGKYNQLRELATQLEDLLDWNSDCYQVIYWRIRGNDFARISDQEIKLKQLLKGELPND